MKSVAAVLVAILFGIQNVHPQSQAKVVPPYRTVSSARVIKGKNAWTYVTENRSFRFAEVLGDGGNYEALLLLEERYHNEHTDGQEGVKGTATLKAWTMKQGRKRDLRWTINETGNEGEVQGRFYRVTAWGCCDVPVVYSYYDVLTGKKLYVSNSNLLEVWGDGDGPLAFHYVAFGYAGLSDLSQPPQLQYGTDKKVAQRFSIVAPRQYYDAPQIFVSTNETLEKSLDLRGSPMDFTIVLKYLDGVELHIPVEADVIRPEKVLLPTGISLRAEK